MNKAAYMTAGAVCCLLLAAGTVAREATGKTPETSGRIVMNVIEIKGRIERPQAVYIINLAAPEYQGIKLEKEFGSEVRSEEFEDLGRFGVDEKLPALVDEAEQ